MQLERRSSRVFSDSLPRSLPLLFLPWGPREVELWLCACGLALEGGFPHAAAQARRVLATTAPAAIEPSKQAASGAGPCAGKPGRRRVAIGLRPPCRPAGEWRPGLRGPGYSPLSPRDHAVAHQTRGEHRTYRWWMRCRGRLGGAPAPDGRALRGAGQRTDGCERQHSGQPGYWANGDDVGLPKKTHANPNPSVTHTHNRRGIPPVLAA